MATEKIVLRDWFDETDNADERKSKEIKLKKFLIEKNVIFTISRSNMIRSIKVKSVEISWNSHYTIARVFLNEYPCDNDKPIKIEMPDNLPDYIMGIPSGEVIFTTKENIEKLKLLRYVRHEYVYAYKDLYIKDVNIFRDVDLNEIISVLHNSPDEDD